jgi:integrase
MLDLGDMHQDRGHYIATIRYGKGGKKDEYVKIPPDVMRDIERYQNNFERRYHGLDAPLFISFRKGDHPSIIQDQKKGQCVEARIDVKAIETTVKDLGHALGLPDAHPLIR